MNTDQLDAATDRLMTALALHEDARDTIASALADVYESGRGDTSLTDFPWRVYAPPRPTDNGHPWLVNAFTSQDRAETFTQWHPTECGPLTIVNADQPAPHGDGDPGRPVDDGTGQQFTLVAHTRITVTAQNPEAAARLIADLTDQAAALMEDSAPGDVIVHRSTLTDAAATTDREIWGDLEPCDQCDQAGDPSPADFPFRVYGAPRPEDDGKPWLVNAFATVQGARGFVQANRDRYGPLVIVNADTTPAGDGGSAA